MCLVSKPEVLRKYKLNVLADFQPTFGQVYEKSFWGNNRFRSVDPGSGDLARGHHAGDNRWGCAGVYIGNVLRVAVQSYGPMAAVFRSGYNSADDFVMAGLSDWFGRFLGHGNFVHDFNRLHLRARNGNQFVRGKAEVAQEFYTVKKYWIECNFETDLPHARKRVRQRGQFRVDGKHGALQADG